MSSAAIIFEPKPDPSGMPRFGLRALRPERDGATLESVEGLKRLRTGAATICGEKSLMWLGRVHVAGDYESTAAAMLHVYDCDEARRMEENRRQARAHGELGKPLLAAIDRTEDAMRSMIATTFEALESDQDFRGVFAFAKRWAGCAFPSVRAGHRLAASLMATSGSEALEVASPWPAWTLHVPDDLVPIGVAGAREHVERVLVHAVDGVWWLCAVSQTSRMWRRGPLEDLCSDDAPANLGGFFAKRHDDTDERVWAVLVRYVIGVANELSDPTRLRQADQRKSRSVKKRLSDKPTTWDYVLRRDVQVDVREAVADYLAGTGRRWTIGPGARAWALEASGLRTGARESQAHSHRAVLARARGCAHRGARARGEAMSLTRYTRGPRSGVAHLYRLTGAQVLLDFTAPDEMRQMHAATNERWEKATTPSKALAEAVAKLDVYGRRVDR